MNTAAERLAFLLAASGYTEQMIRDSLKESALLGPDELFQRVRTIRRAQLGRSQGQLYAKEVTDDSEREERNAKLAEQIVMMLQNEAHIPPAVAADRLYSSLAQRKGGQTGLPHLRKKEGFLSWLKRLARCVPSSELLHHATRIRNEALNLEPAAWPLRDREK